MSLRSLQLPPVKNSQELSECLKDFNTKVRNGYICNIDLGTKGKDSGKNLIIFDEGKMEALVPVLRDFPGTLTETELAGKAAAIQDSEKLTVRGYGNVLLGTESKWVVLFDPPVATSAAKGPSATVSPSSSLTFDATTKKFFNKKPTPVEFLRELVMWGRSAPNEIFEERATEEPDVYDSVRERLGPYLGLNHRKACMLEVMRVLGGYETEWNWNDGMDESKASLLKKNPVATEAGLWQVSADSLNHKEDLKRLVQDRVGTFDPVEFQKKMKSDHLLAMEYIARLLRHTVKANGPVKRHEIDPFLSVKAVEEFQRLLTV